MKLVKAFISVALAAVVTAIGLQSGLAVEGDSKWFNVHCVNDEGHVYVQGTTTPGSTVTCKEKMDGSAAATASKGDGGKRGFVLLHGDTADGDGYFYVPLENLSPGLHTIVVTATDPKAKTNTVKTVFAFVNDVSVGSGGRRYREEFDFEQSFDPTLGQSLSVPVNSTANDDHFDAEVLDELARNTGRPVGSGHYNRMPREKPVKKLWDRKTIKAGTNTLVWDGRDGKNAMVPAGPYIIRISRSTTNEDLRESFTVLATVLRSRANAQSTPPVISDVVTTIKGKSVDIAWKTNVPTTGHVAYSGWGCYPTWTVPVGGIAKSHVVHLPDTESLRIYDYWIVAKDKAGNMSASEKKQIMAEWDEDEANRMIKAQERRAAEAAKAKKKPR